MKILRSLWPLSFLTLASTLGTEVLLYSIPRHDTGADIWLLGALLLWPVIIVSGACSIWGIYLLYYRYNLRAPLGAPLALLAPNMAILLYLAYSFMIHARWLYSRPAP